MKKNDVIGVMRYYKVVGKEGDVVKLEDIYKGNLLVDNVDDLEDFISNPSTFDKTLKVPKSELLNILSNAGPLPFTIEFIKQNGDHRVLLGTFVGPEPHFGRSIVRDLEMKEIRQVDNRTVESLIINNIKYEV